MPRDDDVPQIKCWTADKGHVWMKTFDALPPMVRNRLRQAEFNLCAACLVAFFLPEVQARHPEYSREKMLLTAVETMERELRLSRA
jgi:hypothetical protein